MRGRTVLVTGANTGIGAATARALAARGARVFFAGRSEGRTRPTMEAIARDTGNGEVHFLPLDLEDLDSVKACADAFLARGEPLHVLVANAGIVRGRGTTRQGFERTFGVNHLGHFLLTLALRPALLQGAPARVVVVASRAHERARRPLDLDALTRPGTSVTGWPEYVASKLANVLFVKALAVRWAPDGVHAYAVHPGVIASDLWRELPRPLRALARAVMRTPEQGARAAVRCAVDPELAAHTGRYYGEDGRERRESPLARDAAAADALWAQSLSWTARWR